MECQTHTHTHREIEHDVWKHTHTHTHTHKCINIMLVLRRFEYGTDRLFPKFPQKFVLGSVLKESVGRFWGLNSASVFGLFFVRFRKKTESAWGLGAAGNT
jgi:hypothetical protein